ncbi:MAG TPA: FKBP-type peptidyl-prolyl cis-trans isomerase [Taishania sp.]|nr:FKBP-type peptidyl-prolyl cis-trans isomerase [Taishania sp.]
MGVADILAKRKREAAEKNLLDGFKFQDEFAKREGVVRTNSGLLYEVLVQGDGFKPSAKDKVVCHYHGTTITGEVFDSSVERGKPATFPLNRVIKGWTEGLQLMNVGSKFKFVIPADLAYGEEAISKQIGPNSTLVFEVELIDIQ